MAPSLPSVSVVVCTYQRRALLERALGALERQTYAGPLDVVVVDNGSTDDTAARLRAWVDAAPSTRRMVRLDTNHRVGAARNRAVELTTGEIVAFTDDDCRAEPGWVAALVAAMVEGVDIVQGKTIPDPAQPIQPGSRSQWVLAEDGLFETCNIAYRRAALEAAGPGPFRTVVQDRLEAIVGRRLATQPFGEDVDLGWRSRRAGAQVTFADGAVVHHEVLPPSARVMLHRAAVAAGFPLLTREVPELRSRYWARVFLSRKRPASWALTVGAASLVAGAPIAGATLVGAWAAARVQPAKPGRRARVRGLPLQAARDVVETVSLAYGSIRGRTPVL